MTPDLPTIVEKLSEAEVHLLKQMTRGFSIHPGSQTRAVRLFLRRAEIELGLLTNPSFDNYFLTPLGIEVRTFLQSQGDE